MGGQIPHGNHPLGERPTSAVEPDAPHAPDPPAADAAGRAAAKARLKLSLPARPLRRGSRLTAAALRAIDRCWSAIVILLTLAIAGASFSMYRPA